MKIKYIRIAFLLISSWLCGKPIDSNHTLAQKLTDPSSSASDKGTIYFHYENLNLRNDHKRVHLLEECEVYKIVKKN